MNLMKRVKEWFDGDGPIELQGYPAITTEEGGYKDIYVKHLENEVISLRHEKDRLLNLYERTVGAATLGEMDKTEGEIMPAPIGGIKSWRERRAELEKADYDKAVVSGKIKVKA